jgi:hypothetical protein
MRIIRGLIAGALVAATAAACASPYDYRYRAYNSGYYYYPSAYYYPTTYYAPRGYLVAYAGP